jgi:hypothetical protein
VLEPGVREDNDNIPQISKLQIDLMVNSFAADFARVATLQYTNSVGQARFRWLGIEEGQHDLSHQPDSDAAAQEKLTRINHWYCEQLAYLAKRSPKLPSRAGRQPARQHADRVDQRTGQGQLAHPRQHPFVLVGGGLGLPHGPLRQSIPRVAHNRLLLSLAHGMGHRISRFGNPDFLR